MIYSPQQQKQRKLRAVLGKGGFVLIALQSHALNGFSVMHCFCHAQEIPFRSVSMRRRERGVLEPSVPSWMSCARRWAAQPGGGKGSGSRRAQEEGEQRAHTVKCFPSMPCPVWNLQLCESSFNLLFFGLFATHDLHTCAESLSNFLKNVKYYLILLLSLPTCCEYKFPCVSGIISVS